MADDTATPPNYETLLAYVPEDRRAEFGRAYQAASQAAVTKATEGLKSKNDELIGEKRKLQEERDAFAPWRSTIEELGAESPEQLARRWAAAEGKAPADVEALVRDRLAEATTGATKPLREQIQTQEKKLAEADARHGALRQRLHLNWKRGEVARAMAKDGVPKTHPDTFEALLQRAAPFIQVVEVEHPGPGEPDYRIQVATEDGMPILGPSGTGASVEQLIVMMAEGGDDPAQPWRYKTAGFFQNHGTGGGATGASAGGPSGSVIEKLRKANSHAEYKALRDAMG